MRGVDALTKYFIDIMVATENSVDLEDTLYSSAVESLRRLPEYADFDTVKDELPEQALTAAKIYCLAKINTRSIEDVKTLHNIISRLVALGEEPENIDPAQVVALADDAKDAAITHLHLVEIVRNALAGVDYEHVAEMGFETGRKRILDAVKSAQ
jgi:hypothetical protein